MWVVSPRSASLAAQSAGSSRSTEMCRTRSVDSPARRDSPTARQAAGLECGELQLATVYSVSLGVLPPALRAWSRANADVHVRLLEHRHADELLASMESGRADVGVGPRPPDWDGPVH